MTRLFTFLRRYWPSGLCLAVIIYATLSSDPIGADELPLIPHIDKIIHFIMMGGFAGAIAFDYYRADTRRHGLTLGRMARIAAAVAVFSIFDEIAQATFTDCRGAELYDLLADWAGCLVALLLAPPAVRAVVRRR